MSLQGGIQCGGGTVSEPAKSNADQNQTVGRLENARWTPGLVADLLMKVEMPSNSYIDNSICLLQTDSDRYLESNKIQNSSMATFVSTNHA